MAAKKSRLNNLTDVLNAVDRIDTNYANAFSEERKKDLWSNLWILMRYTSNVSGDYKASNVDELHYIIMTQMLVNKDFMKVSEYPELQWKLLTKCGIGKKMFHTLLPPAGAKKKSKYLDMLTQVFPENTLSDIEYIIKLNSTEKLQELCIEYGFTKKEVDSAFKGQ
jgi:hypothetical protein